MHEFVTFIMNEVVPPAGTVTMIDVPMKPVNSTVAVWCSEVLFPVMTTAKTPAEGGVHDSVAVAGPRVALTIVGEIVPQNRTPGTKVAFRLTWPLKPAAFVTVIVEVADAPATEFTGAGEEALIEKSAPNVNVAEVV